MLCAMHDKGIRFYTVWNSTAGPSQLMNDEFILNIRPNVTFKYRNPAYTGSWNWKV